MDSIWKRLDELGIPHDETRIHGRKELRPAEPTEGATSPGESRHAPVLVFVEARRIGASPDEPALARIDASSPDFESLDNWLRMNSLQPVRIRSTRAGEALPEDLRVSEFSLPAGLLREMWQERGAVRSWTMRRDPGSREGWERSEWARFRMGRAFADHPGTREDFLSLRQEFVAGDYALGMGMGDYWDWYHASSALLEPDGSIRKEVRDQAVSMLDAWKNDDEEGNRYWLTRNLEVHPRHSGVFHDLVAETRAARADPGAATGPRP